MRRFFILSFYLSCASFINACSYFSNDTVYNDSDTVFEKEFIDATISQNSQCGTDGISCNNTALINYERTEADYRQYGERTKRDHLYTQSGTGNNLTATIRPDVEDDVITDRSYDIAYQESPTNYKAEDVFGKTGSLDIKEDIENPEAIETSGKIGLASNVKEEIEARSSSGGSYQVVCEDECDDILNEDIITSEFTDADFDIADIENIDSNSDLATQFANVGGAAKDIMTLQERINADIEVKEVKISDNTILTWEAEEGDNLRELLTKWSALAGWKLLWNTNRNYVLSAGVMFKGKFADVSSALIRAFARARPAPIATYYKGNRVIVVETMENENAY